MSLRARYSKLAEELERTLYRNEEYIGQVVWDDLKEVYEHIDYKASDLEEELEELKERVKELEQEVEELEQELAERSETGEL